MVTGAGHADVLEPAAGPGLMSVHAELPAAQVFGDLPGKKGNQERSETSCALEPTHSTFAQQESPPFGCRVGRQAGLWASADPPGISQALSPPSPRRPGASGREPDAEVGGLSCLFSPSRSLPWHSHKSATGVVKTPQQVAPRVRKQRPLCPRARPSAERTGLGWG